VPALVFALLVPVKTLIKLDELLGFRERWVVDGSARFFKIASERMRITELSGINT